jgi:ABC-type Fe3+-hydroxamate transport system substrate-binding protein
MIRLMAALAMLALPGAALAQKRELTDVAGRKVALELPAKRVVIGMYIEDVVAIAGEEGLSRIAALSTGTMRDWTAGKWRAYAAALPALAALPDVGEVEAGTFSIEKVVATRPDAILLASWQAESLGPNLAKLEAAGIPVVVVDFNSQTIERHMASARLIGALLGTGKRAEALANAYRDAVLDVQARVAKAGGPRPRVYVELGNKGPAQYGNSYGKAMWGQLVEMAGGDNIARDKIGNWGPLTAEAVIAARPEHVFISGGDWPNNPVALRMGFGVEEQAARSKLAEFVARPGWVELPAVRQARVHAVSQSMIRSLHDYTQLQFIAKMLYPAAFADVDPQRNVERFYQAWLPVKPEGVFMFTVR